MAVERLLIRVLALTAVLAVLLAAVYAGHHPQALLGHGPVVPPDPWRATG
jgi:hypothetical protein